EVADTVEACGGPERKTRTDRTFSLYAAAVDALGDDERTKRALVWLRAVNPSDFKAFRSEIMARMARWLGRGGDLDGALQIVLSAAQWTSLDPALRRAPELEALWKDKRFESYFELGKKKTT